MSRIRWALLGLVVVCLGCCLLLLPCVQKVSDDAGWVRSASSLGQIGMAMQTYHDVNGKLPPAVAYGKVGQPLYSWRVLLLPYLEQDRLYKQFKLDEPWDSPHNKPLSENTPKCYLPALGGNDPPGLTRYQVFVGPGTAFERDGLTWDEFPDSPANTLLVVEAGEPVPWSKPVDMAYDPGKPLPPLGGVFGKPVHFLCYEVGRRPGFGACFGDGKARFVRGDTAEKTLRGLISRDGGEPVDLSGLD